MKKIKSHKFSSDSEYFELPDESKQLVFGDEDFVVSSWSGPILPKGLWNKICYWLVKILRR